MFPVTMKTDDYTLVAGDTDKEIRFNKASAVTLTLPSSATAGNGFSTMIRNVGDGDLTIEPDGSETIEGAPSIVLKKYHWCWLGNDGSAFHVQLTGPDSLEYMNPVIETDDVTILAREAGQLRMLDSASSKSFSLPSVSATTNRRNVFAFKNINDGKLIIGADGNDLIDDAPAFGLARDRSVILVADKENDQWRSLSISAENTDSLVNMSFIDVIDSLGLTTGLKLALDAGDADSYPGTDDQFWHDLSGNDADFFLGSSATAASDDPTFAGTSGGLSSSEYFSFDGGDFFRYATTPETWMQNLHKDNAKFTAVCFFYHAYPSRFFGGTASGVQRGLQYYTNASAKQELVVTRGATPYALLVNGDSAIGADQWHMVALTIDEASGSANSFFYLDGDYDGTFNGAYSSPTSGDMSQPFEIGAVGGGTAPSGNGSRIAAIGFWEGATLSKANCDAIWDRMKGRFGLS